MPIYHYQCIDCGAVEQRIAGLDDHTAICSALALQNGPNRLTAACGGLMLRLDDELFTPYFDQTPAWEI